MTVATTSIIAGPYAGDDLNDTYSYPFYIETDAEIQVYETDDTGVTTLLTLTTHYTVDRSGKTVTRVAGVLPTGYEWYLRSNISPLQSTSFVSQGSFFPVLHEAAFDKLTRLYQQLLDITGRILRFSSYDGTGASTELPPPEANKALFWNSTADALELRDLSSVVVVGPDDVHAATSKATPVGADELALVDSADGWGLKKLTLTNLVAYLAGLCSAGWNAFTANRVDSGEVTVTAHATTGDIFAAAANSILWDDSGGAITCTGFPAASKAGLVRNCRTNGATKITAGANLEIEGVPSGTTITLADKAQFTVRAITTTLHRMTYSVSGTFTATGTGFTSNPSVTANYKVENGFAEINIPGGTITGTSNSTSFTITGLPACLVPVSAKSLALGVVTEGSTPIWVCPYIFAGASTITFYKGSHLSTTSFVSSGTRELDTTNFSYSLK